MPVISTFYGIVVMMFFLDRTRHKRPHIHARYQDREVVIGIPEGDVLEGNLPPSKMRLLIAWVEIHKNELMEDWKRASRGQPISKIEPLR
jgi:hypothetical protein